MKNMACESLTTSFEYLETVDQNLAHPMSGLFFDESHIEALNQAQADIERHREVYADDNARQLFAGIIDDKGEYLLLSIDAHWREEPSTYTVRLVPFTRQPVPRYYEQIVPAEIATSFRLHEEYIHTKATGGLYISTNFPDPRFARTEKEEDERVWSVAFQGQGTYGRERIVSVDDALRAPTPQERTIAKIAAAQAAITISNYPDRYPRLNAGNRIAAGKPLVSQTYKVVDQQLETIKTAIQSESLNPADRERLVRLAHTIIEIADRCPENITDKRVIDPNKARQMADAEYPVQTMRPRWRRRHAHNIQRLNVSVREAQRTYDRSLRQPQYPQLDLCA